MKQKTPFDTKGLEKEIKEQYSNRESYTFREVLRWKLAERQRLKAEVLKVIDESFGKFGGYDCNKVKKDLKQKLGLEKK